MTMQRLVCTATTLRALPFFSSLADSVIAEALPLLQVRTYAARAAISAPAALVDYVCIVLAGKVNVLQTDESGRETVLEALGEHEFFNEDACLGQRSSAERFEAETESTILFAPRRLIENCLTQDPTTAQLLLQTLTRRLPRARRKIASLGVRMTSTGVETMSKANAAMIGTSVGRDTIASVFRRDTFLLPVNDV